MATAYFMQLLTQMNEAGSDQQHIEIVLHSKPSIPDRTKYIIGKSKDDPLPEMQEIGRQLVQQGAHIIAVPCITAHYFHEELAAAIGVKILNAIEETAVYLQTEGIRRVGIMATDGTICSGLFQQRLAAFDIESIVPQQDKQTQVMGLIYQEVKAGRQVSQTVFAEIAASLFQAGAEVIILGCTELSLIKRDQVLPAGFVDVMEILSKRAVEECGHLKQEYGRLIT